MSIVWALLGLHGRVRALGTACSATCISLGSPTRAIRYPGSNLTVPPLAFAAFQMMFAVITAALLTGAVAERMQFGAFLRLRALWSLVVYAPLAHWVFSPTGWLARQGGARLRRRHRRRDQLPVRPRWRWSWCSGKRQAGRARPCAPHSLPLTLLGAGILWFGWFGFNAGRRSAAGDLAAQALVSTHLAACGGAARLDRRWRSGATGHGDDPRRGVGRGGRAGRDHARPPASSTASAAVAIGFMAGVVGLFAVRLKFRLGYDDSLDVVGVHGVCGVLGTLAVGLFATRSVNPVGHGLIDGGGFALLGHQALAVLVTVCFAFAATALLALAVQHSIGLRVAPHVELQGLDMAIHAETAYEHGDFGSVARGM